MYFCIPTTTHFHVSFLGEYLSLVFTNTFYCALMIQSACRYSFHVIENIRGLVAKGWMVLLNRIIVLLSTGCIGLPYLVVQFAVVMVFMISITDIYYPLFFFKKIIEINV